MIDKTKKFGEIVQKRRGELNISMRKFAEKIGIGVAYQSDIEYGTRAVPENEVLDKIIANLGLSPDDERDLYDIAAAGRGERTIPQDIPNYIRANPHVMVALRTAKDAGAEEADWKRFTEEMNKKKSERSDADGDK
jgi:transcriptional regulator with XRE-family HTH domain